MAIDAGKPASYTGFLERRRMFGWWYICISVAFVLLGMRSAVRGDAMGPIVLRIAIALGFCLLGIGTLRR